ncbi:hypothetical protein XENOCAPTIV_022566 [Xenoophorus captivus]|uniref:HAUS augmin-like complex subunit 6 N-terminal domain-containing protein n=1 Tax=Xenoophorus captivus TaxID=1517983 RepID=A0ABV0R4G0_9TELE
MSRVVYRGIGPVALNLMLHRDKNVFCFPCFHALFQDETANPGSKVVMSLFLSPGGPKFISLMLHLAKHVMLQDMKTFTTGNVYEAGQLNLLCVMELLNHALQLLKEERCQVSAAAKSQPGAQHLQEKCHQMSRVLQELHLIR